jgi:hypothetical protein
MPHQESLQTGGHRHSLACWSTFHGDIKPDSEEKGFHHSGKERGPVPRASGDLGANIS